MATGTGLRPTKELNNSIPLPAPAEPAPDNTSSANHTDLSKQAGLMVVSRGLTLAIQMGSIMILTRVLAKETFGWLSFLLLGYSTVSTLAQLGLPESIFFFFERVQPAARKSFALLTARSLLLTSVGASVILLAMNFLAPIWGYDVNGLFFPLILLAFLELPTLPLPNILIAIQRTKSAAWVNILFGLAQFAAVVLPAIFKQPLAVIIFCLVGYGVIRFITSAILFFRFFPEPLAPLPRGMLKEQFWYSVPLGFSQILWGLNRQIDKYVVAAFLPVTIYSEYVVGSWEIPLLPAIAYTVASVMMPQMVSYHLKGQKEDLLKLWNKSIEKVSIMVLPLVGLFLVAAEEFIAVFFSENYLAAALPFRIYTLIILQRVAAYGSMLKAIDETKVISHSALYLIVINFILSIPLVKLLGMAGPPLAALLANMFTWWYVLAKIKACLGVTIKDVFPFRFYGKVLAIAVLAGVPVLLLRHWLDLPNHLMLILMIIVYLLVYAVLATLIRVVKREDWRYLAQALKWK